MGCVQSFGRLANLVVMLLYQNLLTGHFSPENLPSGPNLEWLLLQSNQIRFLLI